MSATIGHAGRKEHEFHGYHRKLLVLALFAASFSSNDTTHAQVLLKHCDLAPAPCEVKLSAQSTTDFLAALNSSPNGSLHGFVSFSRHPTQAERRALGRAGIEVLAPLRMAVYRVRVAKSVDLSAQVARDLDTQLRLVAAKERAVPEVWGKTGKELQLMVRFHAGVPDGDVAHILSSTLTKHQISDELWSVRLERGQALQLAAHDSIRWVDIGLRLQPLEEAKVPPSVREGEGDLAAIGVDTVQDFDRKTGIAAGLNGRGIRVGVFDAGVDERHQDFGSRRVIQEDSARSWHGTHIAGIIAGDGRMTQKKDSCAMSNENLASSNGPFEWRGVAPGALILDVEKGGREALRAIDFSLHWRHLSATTLGMDVSNHSYEFSAAGVYDNNNYDRDRLIRGDAIWMGNRIPPRLQVTSAGNTSKFFSITKELKNALVVGNWDTLDKAVNSTDSSRGPAFDGRIKPDVVAPGTYVRATGFCEEHEAALCGDLDGDCPVTSNKKAVRQDFYVEISGTSQASAMATGVVALMLDEHSRMVRDRVATGSTSDGLPLPSTLRGVLIHTAGDPVPDGAGQFRDRSYRAPDPTSGWGLIDAVGAVKTIRDGLISEHALAATCSTHVHAFSVLPGQQRLRVTIAWDDVASDPALVGDQPKLVNDLDLVLVDPLGKKHYPWVFDQQAVAADGSVVPPESQHCGEALGIQRSFLTGKEPVKQTTGKDHLNNAEVVDVQGPLIPGLWRAIVTGFSIPQGPQRYSLVGVDASTVRSR